MHFFPRGVATPGLALCCTLVWMVPCSQVCSPEIQLLSGPVCEPGFPAEEVVSVPARSNLPQEFILLRALPPSLLFLLLLMILFCLLIFWRSPFSGSTWLLSCAGLGAAALVVDTTFYPGKQMMMGWDRRTEVRPLGSVIGTKL